MRARNVLLLFVVLAAVALAAGMASAAPPHQDPDRPEDAAGLQPEGVLPEAVQEYAFRYYVKFVCGLLPPDAPEKEPVKPGNYATAINIYNPFTRGVRITKRPALHYREDEDPPPRFKRKVVAIKIQRVLEIDCFDIWTLTETTPGTFVKGMMDISAETELPVVAVYTAQTNLSDPGAPPDSGAGISIDVEYIQPAFLGAK